MGTVNRITRLKAYYRLPSLVRKDFASLSRIKIKLLELLRLWTVQNLYGSSDISGRLRIQLLHARMLRIVGFKNLDGFMLLVYLIDALHSDNAVNDAILLSNKRGLLACSRSFATSSSTPSVIGRLHTVPSASLIRSTTEW